MRKLVVASAVLLTAVGWSQPLVYNGDFAWGGQSWVAGWRPLSGDAQIRRIIREGRPYLHMMLRSDFDGGLVQRVQLPPGRTLSLRLLATTWETPGGGVAASLVRCRDGVVLCELVVEGVKRGELGRNFATGCGGPADLMLRLVGSRGAEAVVDRVSIGEALPERPDAVVAYGPAAQDLVLAPGQGLKIVAPPHPVLSAASEMLSRVLDDLAPMPLTRPGAPVRVELSGTRTEQWPARESYRLSVSPDGVRVTASAPVGAAWGLMSLADLLRPEPQGGVRILAAEVSDGPDLPWRAGWVTGPAGEAVNGVRRLARLKLNTALIAASSPSQGEGDWEVIGREACEAARRHGLEPVAVLQCAADPTRSGLALAVETVARNLAVQMLMINYPGAWEAEVGEAILAAAGRVEQPLTLLSTLDAAGRAPDQVARVLRDWPGEVVLVLAQELAAQPEVARALADAAARGVRYVLAVGADARAAARLALQARARGDACLGLIAPPHDPEPTANAAWRVPA